MDFSETFGEVSDSKRIKPRRQKKPSLEAAQLKEAQSLLLRTQAFLQGDDLTVRPQAYESFVTLQRDIHTFLEGEPT